MISIRNEIERDISLRTEQLKDLIATQYAMAIRAVADYIVEVDPKPAAEFRTHLRTLQAQAEKAAQAEDYIGIQASFRGELRRYRDECVEKLARMAVELSEVASVMQTMADHVNSQGSDLEVQVTKEITRLEIASASNDLGIIQTDIRLAAAGLKASYEQLQLSNHLVVAQLQDEIRMLHREMADQRNTLYTDRRSGAWIRQKVENRIEDLLRQDESFWLMFVRVEIIGSQYSPSIVDLSMQALVQRLQRAIELDSLIGRWSHDLFTVVVETDPALAAEASQQVRDTLSGMYTLQQDGVNHAVCLKVSVTTLPWVRGTNQQEFYLKIGQVAGSLT